MSEAQPSPGLVPLALPPHPAEPRRVGFPWIASAAPVAGAVLIWSVTGSTFALLFAALGPLVAVASVLDARRQARRERRRASADRARALARLRDEIALRHELERDAARRAWPGARRIVERGVPAWRSNVPGHVVIGAGTIPSRVRVEGRPADDADAALLREATWLRDAPCTADTAGGLGFVGPRGLALAAARAAVVQCADAVPPGRLAIDAPATPDWAWSAALPHAATAAPGRLRVVDAGSPGCVAPEREDHVRIVVAATGADLPPGLATVVELGSRGRAVVGGAVPAVVAPELMSAAEAGAWADRVAVAAQRAGLGRVAPLPARVGLSELELSPSERTDRSHLRVPVGMGEGGPFELDLAAGPHALVAGTSGSGKSEFLVTWVAALAAIHPPDRVAFLLVDFKGGAAFAPVANLPHVTGVVTDLAAAEADRAVASLRAELRHREHVLAGAGARELAQLDAEVVLPRLVVVVDEFQAMVERFPDLGPVIADIAARGRSLGVHLVLASQRPNGVVRESVTANCGIRVSLRVLHRADSLAVVGTEGAAELDAGSPGRAVADPGDGRAVRFQSAIVDDRSIRLGTARHADVAPPRRPWLDPLPRSLSLDAVGGVLGDPIATATATDEPGGLLLGVADDPDRQRRLAVSWNPAADGPLIVLGMPGSGRTSLLDAVAAQVSRASGAEAVLRVEGPRSAVWDALAELEHASDAGHGLPRLVVLDDLDERFAAWPDEARFAGLARVEGLLRAVRGTDTAVIASSARLAGLGPGLRDGFRASALLRHASRADLVHAGGEGALWEPDPPAGSGQWRGLRAQFVAAPAPGSRPPRRPPRYEPARHPLTAICSATPRADATALLGDCPDGEIVLLGDGPDAAARAAMVLQGAAASARPRLVIGDAESWAANWALAVQARGRATIVIHGGPVEYRALAREGGPPPLLDDPRRQCWVIPPEGDAVRCSWIGPDD
ncbi:MULTISPECIES: FtsK/SpoIIIE domain-containing protein [unclassified Agromyces]|uniref:FtsK/SpoIIIE domain-containing protein n=1 Tax=unclassified Agromyces TaxID=2639701 RepID=UPI0030153B93